MGRGARRRCAGVHEWRRWLKKKGGQRAGRRAPFLPLEVTCEGGVVFFFFASAPRRSITSTVLSLSSATSRDRGEGKQPTSLQTQQTSFIRTLMGACLSEPATTGCVLHLVAGARGGCHRRGVVPFLRSREGTRRQLRRDTSRRGHYLVGPFNSAERPCMTRARVSGAIAPA